MGLAYCVLSSSRRQVFDTQHSSTEKEMHVNFFFVFEVNTDIEVIHQITSVLISLSLG